MKKSAWCGVRSSAGAQGTSIEFVIRHWLFVIIALSFPYHRALGYPSSVKLDFPNPDFGIQTSEFAYAILLPAPAGQLPQIQIIAADSVVSLADGQSATLAPTELVRFGERARVAGLDVVPLVVARQRRPTGSEQLVSYQRLHLQLDYGQTFALGAGRTAMARQLLRDWGEADPGTGPDGYLIIVPDDFYNNILPLAEWKRRKGFVVWVKKTSETGTQSSQIRDYIRTAYNTWTPAPSYVLLVGAVNKVPTFITPGTSCVTDHSYACVDGADYLADLYVGRLPAANSSELDAIVAKILGYEMRPDTMDTTWYRRALAVGTSYQEGGSPAVTALVTVRWIRELMLRKGFTRIDTVFYPPTASGRGPVDSAVNRGVSFVNGRGWGNSSGWGYPQYFTSDVYNLANGWKLPVVTSIYCGTGNFQANPCFGEAWLRAGTPSSPKGAVAFWGSSYTGTSTRWNNCMDYGIYRAIFDRNITTIGPALYAGKLEQLANFPMPYDTFDLRLYFHVYNLLGDPGMEMWTGVPRSLTVSYPGTIPVGTSSFTVTVRNRSGNPVPGATVCLYQRGGVHEVTRTSAAGLAHFTISTLAADTLFVTVTGPNLVPHLGYTLVQAEPVFVGLLSHSPLTVRGGSNVALTVTLKNFGTSQTATNVTAVLRRWDSSATVTDSVRNYGDIAPGESRSAPPFQVTIAPGCTSDLRIPFVVAVTSPQGNWQSGLELVVQGPTLWVTGYTVHDANGILDPGEQADISVTVRNSGDSTAHSLTGVLRSLNPSAVAVLDSTGGFEDIAPGDSAANGSDRFRVSVAPGIGAGRRFTLRLVMSGNDGFEFFFDFPVTVGALSSSAPLGPDRYGYYAYDNTDAGYPERPDYSWIEIDPAQGGSGTHVEIGNDRAVPISLPFRFRFYGQEYDTISVCDNGYVALGSTWLGDPYNWKIPSASGPDGFVAPFWDDFRCDTMGASGVFYHYDAANHRFIVEWSGCRHVHGFRSPEIAEPQTFEAIFYDPAFHPTLTGDGPIVFQYQIVQNDDSQPGDGHNFATTGIQSPDHNDGLEYTFAGSYPVAAAVLVNGRAIRFTTNPPDTFTAVVDVRPVGPIRPWLRVWPNPARQVVHLTPAAMQVRVFDVLGREVVVLDVPKTGPGGVTWDLKDRQGRRVPAGVYQLCPRTATLRLCPRTGTLRFGLTPASDKDMILIGAKVVVLE